MASAKILIIDDDDEIGELVQLQLAEVGLETTFTNNINTAFDKISSEDWDAVVSDVRMPFGGVQALFEKLKAVDKLRPESFVLMSGYSDLSPEALQKLGVAAFLTKPCDNWELIEEVKKILFKRGRG